GDIADFPFIEAPDGKAISDGFNLLQELSAVSRENQLTPLGRQLARIPIDPRLGRMLLEAAQQGSLDEVLVVASALSVQDVRERPSDRQQAADQAHAQWKDVDSDFAALINLWRGFEEQRQALGSSALRSWCRRNFLNYLRLREWRDAHRQLTLICRELQLSSSPKGGSSGLARDQRAAVGPQGRRVDGHPVKSGKATEPVVPTTDTRVNAIARQQAEASEAAQKARNYAAVHKAILAGLLSQIGQKIEDGDF